MSQENVEIVNRGQRGSVTVRAGLAATARPRIRVRPRLSSPELPPERDQDRKEFPSVARKTINGSGRRERASLPALLDGQPRATRGAARGGADHLHGRAQRRDSLDGPLLRPDPHSRPSWSTRSTETRRAAGRDEDSSPFSLNRQAGSRVVCASDVAYSASPRSASARSRSQYRTSLVTLAP
jgi:hypothetical protein